MLTSGAARPSQSSLKTRDLALNVGTLPSDFTVLNERIVISLTRTLAPNGLASVSGTDMNLPFSKNVFDFFILA